MNNSDHNDQTSADSASDEIYSVPVKAGKRIYYFDVKSTRAGDYYITITESRKRAMRDGSFVIDKHKIHLYKEDFEKFGDGFAQALDYIRRERPDSFENQDNRAEQNELPSTSSDQGYTVQPIGISTLSDDDFFDSL